MPFDISKYLPGFKSNTAAAEGNISQLLGGTPSTANARNKAAYFGATSGLPNSGVSDAIGFDLYGQQAAADKQLGFEDLIKMITSYPGNAFADPGQQIQSDQFQQNFDERRRNSDLARVEAERELSSRNRPKKYGFAMTGNKGYVPGGFQDREWWA